VCGEDEGTECDAVNSNGVTPLKTVMMEMLTLIVKGR